MKQSVINCTDFESKSPLRSDLNYPEGATLNLDEKGKYRFWQDKSHPIELITTEMIDQRINYVHENPVRSGFVAKAEDYLYSSARNYAGLSCIIEIDMI